MPEEDRIGKHKWCEIKPVICECKGQDCVNMPDTPRENYISKRKLKRR